MKQGGLTCRKTAHVWVESWRESFLKTIRKCAPMQRVFEVLSKFVSRNKLPDAHLMLS